MLKIAFDIGGVLSKYPDKFLPLVKLLLGHPDVVEAYVISDMHDHAKMVSMLHENGFLFPPEHVFSADYDSYGERCKTELCEKLGIDILIDDFVGYVAEGDFMRLLMMPNCTKPYYHDNWKVDGTEAEFGRRKYVRK
jgi:hypothetical protein